MKGNKSFLCLSFQTEKYPRKNEKEILGKVNERELGKERAVGVAEREKKMEGRTLVSWRSKERERETLKPANFLPGYDES